MFIPEEYQNHDPEAAYAFIEKYPFGTMVSSVDGKIFATHLAFVKEGNFIHSHLARANEQSRTANGSEVLLIFSGPNAYVSPKFYDKRQSVPTWNYSMLHVRGKFSKTDLTGDVEASMEKMIAQFEPEYREQFHNLSAGYRSGLENALVAFQIEITSMEMAEKLSQDKSEPERERIAQHFIDHGNTELHALGKMMQSTLKKE